MTVVRRRARGLVAAALLAALGAACSGTTGPVSSARPVPHAPAFHALPASAHSGLGVLERLPSGRRFLLREAGPADIPHPLLVVLHGLYLSPSITDRQSHLADWAARHGVTIAFALGQHASWNAGRGCCGYAGAHRVDDVAYLSEVVAEVERLTPVDRRRVGLVGDSAGGMLALRAACDRSDLFSLGASVGGPLLVPCRHPARLLRIAGRRDAVVPASGGYVPFLRTRVPSLSQERALLSHGAWERVVPWPGGHEWPTARLGLDATSLIGRTLQRWPLPGAGAGS